MSGNSGQIRAHQNGGKPQVRLLDSLNALDEILPLFEESKNLSFFRTNSFSSVCRHHGPALSCAVFFFIETGETPSLPITELSHSLSNLISEISFPVSAEPCHVLLRGSDGGLQMVANGIWNYEAAAVTPPLRETRVLKKSLERDGRRGGPRPEWDPEPVDDDGLSVSVGLNSLEEEYRVVAIEAPLPRDDPSLMAAKLRHDFVVNPLTNRVMGPKEFPLGPLILLLASHLDGLHDPIAIYS